MGGILILSILKFLGLGIGLASTVWGMTRNPTSTDDEGRKRLTPAGHVAITLALGSFLVAGASQGFEVLATQAEERQADVAAAQKAAEDAAKEARALRSEQRQRRTLDLAVLTRAEALARAAEERAAVAEARLLVARTAADQRQRDLALSRDVNRASRENLAQAGVALGQLERLLQPIQQLEVTVGWEMPLGAELEELRQALRRTDRIRGMPGISNVGIMADRILSIGFDEHFPHYPQLGADPEAAMALLDADAHIRVFGQGRQPADFSALGGFLSTFEADGSDLSFDVWSGTAPSLGYTVSSNTLTFVMRMRPQAEIGRSGHIVSITDLERSTLAIWLRDRPPFPGHPFEPGELARLRTEMRPAWIEIAASGRRYRIDQRNIRRIDSDMPVFVASLEGSAAR